jgi:hypothetical protein
MKSRIAMPFALAAAMLALIPRGAVAQTGPRELICFVVSEEGTSAEGNSLYLRKMGVDPEALRSFAPSRFTVGPGDFSAVVQGRVSYEAGTPVLADRVGKLALYEVPLRLAAAPPPRAQATVIVQFNIRDLASGRGIVQPALRAMQLAAAKARMRSGFAWIVEMARVAPGTLRAKVGLAK